MFLKIGRIFYFIVIIFAVSKTLSFGAEINVPGEYGTIQEAINAANPDDSIVIAPGYYNETLVIEKNLQIIGSGTSSTILWFYPADPLITINGPCTVEISGLEIEGGEYNVGIDNFLYASPKGIVATDATLILNDVVINQIGNYGVTMVGGSLEVTDVSLGTRSFYPHGWDIGFQLNGCTARFNRLRQELGWIDHTININDTLSEPPPTFSDVLVENSTIRACDLHRGDCIRTYVNSKLEVRNCYLYRPPGGDPATAYNHTGISISGPSNDVAIHDNTFEGVPCGINVYGGHYTPNDNKVVVERNSFIDSEVGGIFINSMNYEGIDLGGGAFGSVGANQFFNSATFDIQLFRSSADFFALNNTWSVENPGDVIWDKEDDPQLGQVIYDVCSDYTDKGLCNDDPNCVWVGSPKKGSCQHCPDSDGDGYLDASCGGDDCNDGNAEVNPGFPEADWNDITCIDQIDNDCDGLIDGDDPHCPDCVQTHNKEIGPSLCSDGLDNDCNGKIDCADKYCKREPVCK